MERLETIEAHLRLWGLDKLTPTGVMQWTNDVQWLIEQAEKTQRYEKALKSIYEIIGYEDDEKMVDALINTVERALRG